MTRSNWPSWPIMPLDLWRKEIGYNPWHFWGLADSSIVPITSKCNDVVREYSSQSADAAGRADVRSAIYGAEGIFFNNLNFWPAPVYSSDTLEWPHFHNLRVNRLNRMDARGGWVPVRLNELYLQDVGVETLESIQNDCLLTYTDNDGDGLKENWTITVATTVDVSQIAVYFIAADRLPGDDGLSARWRVEPVTVIRVGGNVVISGKRWLVVKPLQYEDKSNYPIDPTVDANFVVFLDVYRRYTLTTGVDSQSDSQAALIWESKPTPWGYSPSSIPFSTDPHSEGWVAGRVGIRDAAQGIVVPAEAVYDPVTGNWYHPDTCLSSNGEPDRVLIRYLAGYSLEAHGWVDPYMVKIISRLSAAEMTRKITACDEANREWSNWQFDVSRVNAPEVYQINLDVLSNPIGTRRGHIWAWQQFQSLARSGGMLV